MNDGVAYQNKDIVSKVFADNFAGKSLKVYGLNIPKIIQVLPTNLPEVSANELRIDNLFLLEDGTIAIIDYESTYKEEHRNKYINYIARVLSRYEKQGRIDISIRMIVIYTADVTRAEVKSQYDIGSIRLEIECAFLSEIDSKEVMRRLSMKVNNGDTLSEEELMEFIILPLTYTDKDRKAFAIEQSIDLAKKIEDEEIMTFILTGLLVFTDKIIDDELCMKVKEWIKMTKIGRLYEAEKDAALAEKDATLAEKDAALAEKDAKLASEKAQRAKDKARIKELEAMLASK